MALQLKKAQRKRVKLKIGMSSIAGGGKTASSLIMAYGVMKKLHQDWTDEQIWDSIAVIDTENGSSELYSNKDMAGIRIGEFNVISMEPPFVGDKYIEAISLCQENNIEFCIVDGISALWYTMLDKQGNIAKRTGNSYTAWKDPKAEFRRVLDKVLQTDMHFVVTMRAKTEYSQEKDPSGKTVVRKLANAPITMTDSEFEFSLVFDIDSEHVAMASKDRTALFDGQYFRITKETGYTLVDWLNEGKDVVEDKIVATSIAPKAGSTTTKSDESVSSVIESISTTFAEKMQTIDKEILYNIVKEYHTSANFKSIKDIEIAKNILRELTEVSA